MAMQVATFAAGCFWGVEHMFRNTPGVVATAVGYTGGAVDDPTYEQVCTDATGHAEAVRVEFDSDHVTFDELLARFWGAHDPTQKDRQGPDFGTQYRSAIFVNDDVQRASAEASLAARQKAINKPIATEVVAAGSFWPAEDYHQQYLEKRGRTSCLTGSPT